MQPSKDYCPTAPPIEPIRFVDLPPGEQLRLLIMSPASVFSDTDTKLRSLPECINILSPTLDELRQGLRRAFDATLNMFSEEQELKTHSREKAERRIRMLEHNVRALLDGDDEDALTGKIVMLVLMRWASKEFVDEAKREWERANRGPYGVCEDGVCEEDIGVTEKWSVESRAGRGGIERGSYPAGNLGLGR